MSVVNAVPRTSRWCVSSKTQFQPTTVIADLAQNFGAIVPPPLQHPPRGAGRGADATPNTTVLHPFCHVLISETQSTPLPSPPHPPFPCMYVSSLPSIPPLRSRRPVWARRRCRISPPRFLAECCKRQLNQASLVLLYFRLSAFSDLY